MTVTFLFLINTRDVNKLFDTQKNKFNNTANWYKISLWDGRDLTFNLQYSIKSKIDPRYCKDEQSPLCKKRQKPWHDRYIWSLWFVFRRHNSLFYSENACIIQPDVYYICLRHSHCETTWQIDCILVENSIKPVVWSKTRTLWRGKEEQIWRHRLQYFTKTWRLMKDRNLTSSLTTT